MTVRPATSADAGAVTRLERDLFGPDAWSSTVVGELAGAAGEHGAVRRHAVVAEDDGGTVVGYAVAAVSGEVADLERVGVAATHRRTGLGGSLVAAVRRWAGDQGAERMLLEVAAGNDAALALYAVEGFTPVDRRRRYYRDGSDALVLEARLAGADPSPTAKETR